MTGLNNLQLESGDLATITLTHREHEVLELIARGLSAKEVALRLQITARTVETHIDKLRLKTQARNRTHMVVRAIGQGLL